MRILAVLVGVVMSFSLAAVDMVCLSIDGHNTAHPKYPNLAREVGDHTKSFFVFDQQNSCFEMGKAYYMQRFLWEAHNQVAYGTVCRYTPHPKHAGKIVQFIGESGSYDCPVVEHYQQ